MFPLLRSHFPLGTSDAEETKDAQDTKDAWVSKDFKDTEHTKETEGSLPGSRMSLRPLGPFVDAVGIPRGLSGPWPLGRSALAGPHPVAAQCQGPRPKFPRPAGTVGAAGLSGLVS